MDLGHLLSLARRRWWILAACTAAGVALGVAYTELTPPTYRSTTSLFFSLNRTQTVGELAQGSTYLQGLAQSYAEVATSRLVLGPVTDELDIGMSTTELARLVKAEPRPDTAILDIEVSYDSPEGAARLADAVGAELTRAVAVLTPRTSASGASVTVSTISLAAVPTRPAAPRPAVDLGVGLAAGLLLGVAVTALAEAMASPVGTRKAAEAATDAPVLASIGRGRRRDQLPVVTDPRSPRAESFWMLRTNIEARRPADGPMCLVVVSALPAEGRTSTAVNLAIAMSHTAHRVLLVDADLRSPAVAGLLSVDPTDGLSSVLHGVSSLEEAVHTWVSPDEGRSSFAVLPTGPVLKNPSELIASEAMDKLLDMVRQRYDIVILDSPPLLRVADGAVLAARADGALLVVNGRRTRQKQLTEAVDRLWLAGASIIGVVLNHARTRRTGSYRRPRWPRRRPRRAAGRSVSSPAGRDRAAPRGLPESRPAR
jgi:polysaccharide biosynthesis transport protein